MLGGVAEEDRYALVKLWFTKGLLGEGVLTELCTKYNFTRCILALGNLCVAHLKASLVFTPDCPNLSDGD